MWQVQKRGVDETVPSSNSSSSGRADRTTLTFETFTALLESFEAKKKYVSGGCIVFFVLTSC